MLEMAHKVQCYILIITVKCFMKGLNLKAVSYTHLDVYKRQGLVYLLTRNVTKALSVLMVDFSCALKLSMPISVLSDGQGIPLLLLFLHLSIDTKSLIFLLLLLVFLHKILSSDTLGQTLYDICNSISYVLNCLWHYFALAF